MRKYDPGAFRIINEKLTKAWSVKQQRHTLPLLNIK